MNRNLQRLSLLLGALAAIASAQTVQTSCSAASLTTCDSISDVGGGQCTSTSTACKKYVADAVGSCTCLLQDGSGLVATEPIGAGSFACEFRSDLTVIEKLTCPDCLPTDSINNIPTGNTGSDVINPSQAVGVVFSVLCGEMTVTSLQWVSRFYGTNDVAGFTALIYALRPDDTVDVQSPLVVFNGPAMSPGPQGTTGSAAIRTQTLNSFFLNTPLPQGRYVLGLGCQIGASQCSFSWTGDTSSAPTSTNSQIEYSSYVYYQANGDLTFNSTLLNGVKIDGTFTGEY